MSLTPPYLRGCAAYGHVWQQLPAVNFGGAPSMHMSGKHQTFGHSTDSLPPYLPVAPTIGASQPTFGLTQYGQQWPGNSVGRKPAGHLRSPHEVFEHGSTAVKGAASCTIIRFLLLRSMAMWNLATLTLLDRRPSAPASRAAENAKSNANIERTNRSPLDVRVALCV